MFFFWLIADSAAGSLLFFRAALAFISEHIVSGRFWKKKKNCFKVSQGDTGLNFHAQARSLGFRAKPGSAKTSAIIQHRHRQKRKAECLCSSQLNICIKNFLNLNFPRCSQLHRLCMGAAQDGFCLCWFSLIMTYGRGRTTWACQGKQLWL